MTDTTTNDELEFYDMSRDEFNALINSDIPIISITCSRCGDSLECPITNEPCPICVKGEGGGRVKPPAHELGMMVLPSTIQIEILHPTPPRRNHPFSLHLLEWLRSGLGWWGSLFGYYPRIGEGEVDGHTWHFHARGKRWTLVVGSTPSVWAEDEWVNCIGGYRIIGEYQSEGGSAGDMSDDEAWAFIERGIGQWRAMMAKEHEEVVGRWEGEGGSPRALP